MSCLIEWCNINQGFLSAILSVITIGVSFLAILFSRKEAKKQNRIALYEKRTYVLKQLHKLMEFLTWIQLYQNSLTDVSVEQRKRAITMIKPDEITMQWYYDFQNAKFVVGRKLLSDINTILQSTDILLRNYRIFKEGTERKCFNKEEIDTVLAETNTLENITKKVIEKIEKKLKIRE